MDINERIRFLRKEVLHLTQQEFSEALNISRSNMGNIEIGRIAVTDRVISDICEKFNVDETWLRTGEGEPFKPLTRAQSITDFAADLIKEDDSFKARLIDALSKLSEDEWEVLEQIAKKLAGNEKG